MDTETIERRYDILANVDVPECGDSEPMRAFMSERANRLPISETADPTMFCGRVHARQAMREARHILAEKRSRSVAMRRAGRPSVGSSIVLSPTPRKALADALRAFVEED